MKKKIGYWNALFTHILTTGFLFVVLGAIGGIGMIFLLSAAYYSSLLPLIVIIYSVIVTDGSIALATYLSMRFMRRYEIDESDNFVNFSSIIAAIILIIWLGLSLLSFATMALGVLIFYRVTKNMSVAHPVTL